MENLKKHKEKRIIAIPFAYEEGMNTGVNTSAKNAAEEYLQCACVAAASAKHHNPDCTVALVTNISSEMLAPYSDVLKLHGVEIIEAPFDRYRFDKDYRWALAFYKLCALEYIAELGYDKLCYFDSDVYVQGSLDRAWEECEGSILLLNFLNRNGKGYHIMCDELTAFTGSTEPMRITFYGGEFFMADAETARRFTEEAHAIFDKMIADGFKTTKGDEFILNLAAERMKDRVKSARAYIFRFWTGPGYRLVPDSYRVDPVAVLHMPDEKNHGLPILYRKYIVKGELPENSRVWKVCRLNGITLKDRAIRLAFGLNRK